MTRPLDIHAALAAIEDAANAGQSTIGLLTRARWECECGQEHRIVVDCASVADGAAETAAQFAEEQGARRLLLVTDETVGGLYGGEVASALRTCAESVDRVELPPGIHPSRDLADRVLAAVQPEHDLLVSLGSGAINDLTKAAAFETMRGYISLATAPSMNGYLSSITALEVEGVKRTLPAQPPIAVFADRRWLITAPARLCAAGFADWMSKPFANADWCTASALLDERFCRVPWRLLEATEPLVVRSGPLLPRGELSARVDLLHGLLYSGIAMMIAGSSSPASGGEHLISHFLDMFHQQLGFRCALHGEQVAIGILVSAAIYQRLLAMDAPGEGEPLDFEQWRESRAKWYGSCAAAVTAEFCAKWGDAAAVAARRQRLREGWDAFREQWRNFVLPVAQVRQRFSAAGAVHRASDIGLQRRTLRQCILHGREIRSRYTVLDLAFDVGLLPGAVDDIIDDSGVCRT